MNDDRYWKFGLNEVVCVGVGLVLGAAFGFGLFLVRPAPPWWFLPLPSGRDHRPIVEMDTWNEYVNQGGYEFFWLQSTWGWSIVAAILGLVLSNVVLRNKKW